MQYGHLIGGFLVVGFATACGGDDGREGVDSGPDHDGSVGVDGGLGDGGADADASVRPCEEASDCDDGIDCTEEFCEDGGCAYLPNHDACDRGQVCNPALGCVERTCVADDDCDDGNYCNGDESCEDGRCVPGVVADCSDDVPCTTDRCDPRRNGCLHEPDNVACQDDVFCNGEEVCDLAEGCVPGDPVACDDGVDCTTDVCNEDRNRCDFSASDASCDDGVYCNGEEVCDPVQGCEAGDPVVCDDGLYCTVDTCDEDADVCAVSLRACDDGIACTADVCDEAADACATVAEDAVCQDGVFCNGAEFCDPLAGCLGGLPPSCDDGDGCTVDSCEAGSDACVHPIRDRDGDGAPDGTGGCGGTDCDDLDPLVLPGAAESCDAEDDDCDGLPDDGFECVLGSAGNCLTGCGSTGDHTCQAGCTWTACAPPQESCNGSDDDCDGTCDNGWACCRAAVEVCLTACGSTGSRTCSNACAWGNCVAPAETCNGTDDDCDGQIDEGALCAVGNRCLAGVCRAGPAGCTYYNRSAHSYAYCIGTTRTWASADADCVSYGGHLATVGSDGEETFIQGFLTQSTWLGLHRTAGNCTWRWSNGEAVVYTDWGVGLPDSACGDQDCAHYWWGIDYDWDDNWCNEFRAYVCEWE